MVLASGPLCTPGTSSKNIEDAFRTCDGVLDVGPQHGDLLDGLVEALDVGQEGHHQTERNDRAPHGLSLEQEPAAHADHNR